MTNKEFYEKCLLVGKQARKWKHKFVAMLPEVVERGVHKENGFATIVEFAAKVGGVGKSTVDKIFQVERYVADKPALKKLIPKMGVHKVRTVATLATKENQEELAHKVKTMSKKALELFAQEQRAPEISRPGAERTTISFSLDKEVEFELRKFKNKMGSAVEWNDVIKKLLEKAVEKPKKVRKVCKVKKPKKITRYVSTSIHRELPEKCQYPGCNKPAEVVHHPERFSLKPNHNNLKALCKGHHELVHSGFEPKEWNPKTSLSIEKKFLQARLL